MKDEPVTPEATPSKARVSETPPVAKGEITRYAGVQALDPTKPELTPLAERRRVMVVDDDPMMMDVLVRILRRENYELVVAMSGPEALDKAAALSEPVDLLITDYAMPDMKGLELAQRLRERYPALRVLYQTGLSDMLFQNGSELEGGAALLEKPFTARSLREAARSILFGGDATAGT
jgi:two-component system, cell cycle sensor histidine kinase and response regulator CckA